MGEEVEVTTSTESENEQTGQQPPVQKDRSYLGFWMVFCPLIAFCLRVAVLATRDYLRFESHIIYWIDNGDTQGLIDIDDGKIGLVSSNRRPLFSTEAGKFESSSQYRDTIDYYTVNGEDPNFSSQGGFDDAYWTAATVFSCLPLALMAIAMSLIVVRRSDTDSKITPEQAHAPSHSTVEAYFEDRTELSWSLVAIYMLNAICSLLTMLSFGTDICKEAKGSDETCYDIELESLLGSKFEEVEDDVQHREQLCIEKCKAGPGVALCIVAAMFWILASVREMAMTLAGNKVPTTDPMHDTSTLNEQTKKDEEEGKPHLPTDVPVNMID